MLPDSAEIVEAANGLEGLHSIETSQPNLVLLDCQMPKMDGITLLQQIQEHSQFRHIPVVLMSARPDEVLTVLKEIPPEIEFLSKPFTSVQLLKASHQAIKKARQRREATTRQRDPVAGQPVSQTQGEATQGFMRESSSPRSRDSARPVESWQYAVRGIQQEVVMLRRQNESLEETVKELRSQLNQVIRIVRALK